MRSNFRECWDNGFARARGYELSVDEAQRHDAVPGSCPDRRPCPGSRAGPARLRGGGAGDGRRDAALVQHPTPCTRRSPSGRSTASWRDTDGVRLAHLSAARLAGRQAAASSAIRASPSCSTRAGAMNRRRACSGCSDCLANGWAGLQAGVGPARLGIDVSRLLERMHRLGAEGRPGPRRAAGRAGPPRASQRHRPQTRRDAHATLRDAVGAHRASPAAASRRPRDAAPLRLASRPVGPPSDRGSRPRLSPRLPRARRRPLAGAARATVRRRVRARPRVRRRRRPRGRGGVDRAHHRALGAAP